MIKLSKPIILLLFIFLSAAHVYGEEPILPQRKLIVGTKEAPPFSIKTDEGIWKGISIDLWKEIAKELKLQYEFREFDLKDLLEGVKSGSIDAVVAALTMTEEREKIFDFSHPFHVTGLGIAVASKGEKSWFFRIRRFFSTQFLKVVATLTLLLFGIGILVWVVERKRNPQQFGGGILQGIGSAFWWSAVTMTTVGYGDKAPKTSLGRFIAVIWMFTGIIIISSFTAAITLALTVSHFESKVRGPQDLFYVSVATVSDSTSESYLKKKHIDYIDYKTPIEGLNALAEGAVDALVYDSPILKYLINKDFKKKLIVLPKTFEREEYAFALPTGSTLREPINRLLLKKIHEPEWQDKLYFYLGR